MSGAVRRRFPDGRWHFQHGPIDCIVGADGDAAAVEAAIERAWRRFEGILAELVDELPLLRTDLALAAGAAVAPRGPIARRMVAACRPHAAGGRFITAMAAVAGSVAEELIGCFDADPRIARAYVNNGGDTALLLRGDAAFTVGWVADPVAAVLRARSFEAVDGDSHSYSDSENHSDSDAGTAVSHADRCDPRAIAPRLDGTFRVDAASAVRGIATSGWRGRSFSLGIADSVTVLARTASAADAAATVVANAVDADDPRIRRAPANRLRDDSDLGARLVVCAVEPLPEAVVAEALARGVAVARAELGAGRLVAAALCLQGRVRLVEGVVGDAAAARGAAPARGAAAARDAAIGRRGAFASKPSGPSSVVPRFDDAATLGTNRARPVVYQGAAAMPSHRVPPFSSPGS